MTDNSKSSFLRKLRATSQTAAMADMAMLLLVFFLVTTTTELPEEAKVSLPKAQTEGTEPNSYYISISKTGTIFWDKEVVTYESLQSKLAQNSAENSRKVVINADKDLMYSSVSAVLDLLKQYEYLNVIFLSESRDVKKSEHVQ